MLAVLTSVAISQPVSAERDTMFSIVPLIVILVSANNYTPECGESRIPEDHIECGLRIAYVSRKQCDRKGGVLVKDLKGKAFCSFFPEGDL